MRVALLVILAVVLTVTWSRTRYNRLMGVRTSTVLVAETVLLKTALGVPAMVCW